MKIFRLITASALALSLTFAPADLSAQHNGRRPGTSQQNHNRPSRPGNNGQRPGANGSQTNKQPSNTHNTPNHGNFNKPGNNHNQGNHNSRPDHDFRPGGNNHGYQPGHNQKPSHPGGNHGYQPGHNHKPHPTLPPRPAYRPHIPSHHSHNWFNRPVPPAHFRPHVHISPLQAIIGVALGTTLNISLNTLRAANYNIAGYQDNCLYLNDVNALGYLWPEATLYYSGGFLSSSTFSYYTPDFYPGRYNSVYQTLCRTYGAPVTQNQVGSSFSATWWGYDNRYISLEYRPVMGADGYTRYFTTLRMGN